MADILVTHCNHLFFDQKQLRRMQPYPPLQTIMASAQLRKAGFHVAFFDVTFQAPEAGFREALSRHKPRLVVICEDHFNFVSKMCLKRNRDLAFSMARIAREVGIPIAISSSDSADHTSTYLARSVDIVVIGEPEHTLVDLARHIVGSQSRRPADVAGLAFLQPGGNHVHYTGSRQLEKDLSLFPMPAWDFLDMDQYRKLWTHAHGTFGLNLIASRGCSYHCNWCAKPVFGQTYRSVPPGRVIEEVRYLQSKFHPDFIWFADDVFALSPQWAEEFANEVESTDVRIPFKTQSRCDLITDAVASSLHRAGCSEVWLGAESGSQKVLESMGKGIRVTDVYLADKNLSRYGIRTCLFLQFGFPGETWDDIQETIRMIRAIAPADIGISVSYPLPGTRFYHDASKSQGLGPNWSESGDLTVSPQAEFGSGFYRMLHDALHLEVDICNGRADAGDDNGRLQELWLRISEISSLDHTLR